MPKVTLESARLRLRPRSTADVEPCVAMDCDPAVHRFIYPDGVPDPEAHGRRLRTRIAEGWPRTGGIWVVEWRHDPGFLGWCGLFPLEDSGLIEIGYRYIQAAWGQGVGTEATLAVLDHGFRVLELDPIVAVTHPENRASQQVLEKIGLNARGIAFHYGQDLSYYHLTWAEHDGLPER